MCCRTSEGRDSSICHSAFISAAGEIVVAVSNPVSTVLFGLLRIAKFQDRDLTQVLAIERESFGRGAWTADMFSAYRSIPALFLVVRCDPRIAAYCIARISGKRAQLDSIAVAKKFRQRGIARSLLNFVIRTLTRLGIESLSLMVRRDNRPAIALYHELGFRRTRTVRGYYEDRSTAWSMRLALR